MSLTSMLYNVPLYQQVNLPPPKSNIIILCSNDDVKYIPSVFVDYTVRLVISNMASEEKIRSGSKIIPIDFDFTKIFSLPYCYIVIFCSQMNTALLCFFNRELNKLNIVHKNIYMPILRRSLIELYSPNFLDKYRCELEKVYSFLSDDESRKIFASRIKSIMLGTIGYIRQSKYTQYCHPQTMPQQGDVILDGGVSGNISVEERFAKLVGDEGHIYAFEPEPNMYFQAEEKAKKIKNVTLFPFGLSNKIEKVNFISKGPGSHITDTQTDETFICQMTTVDAIVSQYNIKKIDMIKLDVEGSEKKSLFGALKTMEKHRPKLLVSLYHKHNDMFELPLFINALDLDYKFYMGHHSPILWETVLYAVPN